MAEVRWLEPVFVTITTVVVMAAIGRKNGALPEVQNGMLRSRMPKALIVLGAISLILACGFLLTVFQLLPKELPVALLLAMCGAAFAYMGALLVMDGKNHQAACDESTLVVIDGRDRMESCRWTDIVSARMHPLSRMIVLRINDGRKLRINPYLIGSDALFHMMAECTNLPVKDLVAKARAIG